MMTEIERLEQLAAIGVRVRAARAAGRVAVVPGLSGGCRDCLAGGTLMVSPDGAAMAVVFHDDGCPAEAGVVPWELVDS